MKSWRGGAGEIRASPYFLQITVAFLHPKELARAREDFRAGSFVGNTMSEYRKRNVLFQTSETSFIFKKIIF